jgi:hypothetical protein
MEAFHVYCRFCTSLPPAGPFERGSKLYYMCRQCQGPVCVNCLGIEDDYPCPSEQVPFHHFPCPACATPVQVMVVDEADLGAVAKCLL